MSDCSTVAGSGSGPVTRAHRDTANAKSYPVVECNGVSSLTSVNAREATS